nr:putative reverse transcriptase domain-containing protein [Tanacetum cinerariifolium]
KKCLSDESLVISLDELRIDDKLHFVEEPVEIMDHEIKLLKRSRILIIKKLVIHPGSVAARIKDKKCRTRGFSKTTVKHRLVQGAPSSRATRQKTTSLQDDSPFLTISDDDEVFPDVLELQNASSYHLKISNINPLAYRGHLDNQLDVELLNLHDRCYARQVVVDNVVNRRIAAFSGEVKEHKANLEKILLESKKWADYQVSLSTLELKVASLVDEKARLVGKLASASVFYARCAAFEEISKMKETFDLSKVKGYRSSYKKEHTKYGNDLATGTFPFLSEVVADPSATVEAFLSKKPQSL